jgi:hypothetical protein
MSEKRFYIEEDRSDNGLVARLIDRDAYPFHKESRIVDSWRVGPYPCKSNRMYYYCSLLNKGHEATEAERRQVF